MNTIEMINKDLLHCLQVIVEHAERDERLETRLHLAEARAAIAKAMEGQTTSSAKRLSDDEILDNAEKAGFEWHETRRGHKYLIAPADAELGDGYFAIEDELKRFARIIEAAHGIGGDV